MTKEKKREIYLRKKNISFFFTSEASCKAKIADV
jgi:hypothetical protein